MYDRSSTRFAVMVVALSFLGISSAAVCQDSGSAPANMRAPHVVMPPPNRISFSDPSMEAEIGMLNAQAEQAERRYLAAVDEARRLLVRSRTSSIASKSWNEARDAVSSVVAHRAQFINLLERTIQFFEGVMTRGSTPDQNFASSLNALTRVRIMLAQDDAITMYEQLLRLPSSCQGRTRRGVIRTSSCG